MALPGTAPIRLQQIQDEFGAARGTPLTEFIRGGLYVPDTPANAGVPTTVPIRQLQLLGADSNFGVALTAHTVTQSGSTDITATAGWSFSSSGLLQGVQGSVAPPIVNEWFTAGSTPGAGNNYEVQLESVVSGPAPNIGPAVGTWLPLSSTQAWNRRVFSPGTDVCVWRFQIRHIVYNNVVQAQADLTVNVTRT